jgi:putative ABC transport system ATP-binding protein
MRVPAGSLAVITGANGSGKSTLLGVISGEVPADGGEVFVDGKSMAGLPAHRRSRLIGYVHQDSYKSLAGDLAAGEVVALASRRQFRLRFRGPDVRAATESIRKYSNDAADFVIQHRTTPTKQLSGGQRQFLSLIAAVGGDPLILLLDEHQSSLDDEHAKLADALIASFVHLCPAAAVAVSHDFAWVAQNADIHFSLQRGVLTSSAII